MSIQDRIEKIAIGEITITDFLIFYAEQSQSIQQSIIDEVSSFKMVLIKDHLEDYYNFDNSPDYLNLDPLDDIPIKAIVSAHSDISNKHIGKNIYFIVEEIEEYSEAYYNLLNRDKEFREGVEKGLTQRIFFHYYVKYDFKLKEIEDPTELTNRLLTKLEDYKPEKAQSTSKKPMFYHRLMTKLDDYKPEKTTQSTSEESDNASSHKPEETSQDNTFENDYVNYDEVFKKNRISVVEPFKKYMENHKPTDYREASFVFVQLSKRLDVIKEDINHKQFAKWMVDNEFMKEWIYCDEVLKNDGFDASKKTKNKEEYKAETKSRLDSFNTYFQDYLLKVHKKLI